MMSLTPRTTTMYPENETVAFSFKTQLLALAQSVLKWLGCMAHIMCRMVLNAFRHHPSETNETYVQHLWFTTKTSLRFVVLSLLLFVHGVFPFIFVRTVSSQIERIYLMMRSRILQPRREMIENQYDI